MSACKDCPKSFASRQSLCNHRKRVHPTMKLQNVSKKLKSKAQDKEEAQKVMDKIFNREPSKDVQDISLSPPEIVNVDKIVSTDDESDASDNGSEVMEDIKWPEDIKKQDSMLIDAFTKLYSHFDEDDVEMRDNILLILNALKTRGCITDREYTDIKSLLTQRMHLNLYESINSTIEKKTQDDKDEVLRLLRSMNKDKEAEKLISLVKDYFDKDYFEGEIELESVLLRLPKLKDKVNAIKVEIILNQIEKTRDRVTKIFTRLTNGSDKGENLNDLRASNHITDEQYQKLFIGPNTLPSISKIILGKGLYLSRK